MKDDVNEYLTQKTWYLYLPIWIVGVYLFVAVSRFSPNSQQPFIIAIPQAFDFFLHEMAHIFTAFLPAIVTASAGSLSELLLGGLLILGAVKTRCYFASLVCALWFMLACQSAGIYMADARAQQLQLVSLGGQLSGTDKATHDWNFVFGQLHILNFDTLIGNTVRAIGVAVGLAALVFTAWLMYRMASYTKATADNILETKNTTPKTTADKQVTQTEHFNAVATGNVYATPTRGPLAVRTVTDEPENKPRDNK